MKIVNMIFKNRIIQLSAKKSLFLFGIRGSGKTRLLNRLFPEHEALHIDLSNRSLCQSFLSDAGLFYEKVSSFREDGLVIVDEIQKMPELLDEVHRLIESSQRRFILTGSSARKISAEKANLLGGRAGKAHLHPFVPEELGEDFNLDEALRYGLIPIVWSAPDRGDKLKDYIETYLDEDIRAEALVRHLAAFSRFLQVAGLCHGQAVNMSSIARDAGIERYDAGRFFSILEETLLGFFIPAYASRLKIKEKKSPKFYLTDPGLARGAKKNFGPVALEEKGALFEGLIAQTLRAYKSYRSLCREIYYWSPADKATEVDFILEREDGLTAIEAKAREQVSSEDYKGLKAAQQSLPAVKRRVLVYMGKDIRKTEDGIEIWPFDFFCKNLKEDFQLEPYDKKPRPARRPVPAPPLFAELAHPPLPPSKSKKNLEEYKGFNWEKAALSRLSPKKENIALLEKELGLSFSAAGGSSDSAKKKLSVPEQINISEESFDLALMLTDSYFCSGQEDKAWLILEKITEAPLAEADRLEARQYKAFRLISFDKINEAEKRIEPLFEKNPNDIFTLILKSKIEGAREKAKASEGNAGLAKKHRDKKIEYLKKALHIFKDKKYKGQTDPNSPYFESKKRLWLRDIQQLSQELYQSEMHLEAEPLLEEITGQNLNHPKIFHLLQSYFKNGKNRQTADLAEALIKKFPGCLEPAAVLFQMYQDLGDIKKAVQYYESFIQANPEAPGGAHVRLDLIHTYINSGETEKARALLKEGLDSASLPSDLINSLSIAYARAGSIKKALETQYQNIKKHPGKMEPENVYFSLFLNRPQLLDLEKPGEAAGAERQGLPESPGFLQPEAAGPDCYVQIKDIKSLEDLEIVIEKGAEIYTPEHELSQELLGKKPGDKLSFMNKTYQVMEVKSKYVHKYQEIIKKAELRHGSKAFLRSAHISKDPAAGLKDLSKALKELSPDMSKRREGFRQLFQAYREGKATAGLIAKTTARHPLKIMGHLMASEEDKWISAFPGRELYDEARDHLESKSSLLLDVFSLAMIHQIKMEKLVEKSGFDLHVCQSTIDSLKEFGSEMALHAKGGLLTAYFDEAGNLGRDFVPAEKIQRNLQLLEKIKAWAEKFCRIKPISPDFVLRRGQRREWEEAAGKEFLDPLLALYNDPSAVFVSEDAALRASLQSFHREIDSFQGGGKNSPPPAAVRLFDLIEHLKRKAVIENREETQFKAGLIKLNQTYIPIDHNVLLFLLKEAEYSISDKYFQRGLFFLGPVSQLSGALHAAADFFIELCQDPSLLPYRRQMIINEALNKVSFGRGASARQTARRALHLAMARARLFPLVQHELYRYIMEWRKGKAY